MKKKKSQPQIYPAGTVSQIFANKIKNSHNTALAPGTSVCGKEFDFDLKAAACIIYDY